MPAPMRIQSKKTFREVLDEALAKTREIAALDPSWTLPAEIQRQLEFMRACTDDTRVPTDEERTSTDVGPVAVRNFEDSDEAYADLLKELDYAFRRFDALP